MMTFIQIYSGVKIQKYATSQVNKLLMCYSKQKMLRLENL